ncbi:MAG: sigma-70 family RNA polymerase sigma factor [Lachnospiraceae bacterium]|nr:sigma-70 family RNA polymerase sigma factor [Lachnospiraceae bacterium]
MSDSNRLAEQVYLEYGDKIRGYIHSHVGNPTDAEDVASAVFLKVSERSGSFDAQKSALSTWVYAITKNAVIDYYRKRRVMDEVPEEFQGAADSGLEDICRRESLTELAEAMERMPERLRDLIILHYYKGIKLKEVAEVMDMSYANVKVLHKKALAELKKSLDP